jgi:hypothetical protein
VILLYESTIRVLFFVQSFDNIFIQVERVASMLNYFLLPLAGSQRKSLTVKDPEKYEFKPKQLLKQVR